ncbi:PrsW family intramembrane metalloprotease [Saliphagus infecundisoli]|uniref:PrsW family intramembrane metalloprotease n=1 Tax=Saliphagus infecundisoli TaxID=1849069 RepID=A0ABD5QF35_9EURY|nr:PrsW family glutamic-type intramembrane protease [Saliphagus infecundisoli]
MSPLRDPIERSAGEGVDLYDVSTWEPRTLVDRLAVRLYRAISYGFRGIVLAVAALITLSLLVSPALLVVEEPFLGAFFALSAVPALALAAYIWYADVTTSEPLSLLVGTFVLTILFATFAALGNAAGGAVLQSIPVVGMVLFFYLIVGPLEEAVKLLAVRVLAFRSDSFDAVIDGAVYGAVAGLGFAAIENAIYISGVVAEVEGSAGLLAAATGITTVRALVGPGHVIYSAIAGYYLGLAKFNPENAGPLVVKGLLVAAVIHATYNSTAQVAPDLIAGATGIGPGLAFVGYVVAFDAAAGYYLYRKITRYRRRYRQYRVGEGDPATEVTEIDPPNR